VDVYVTHLSLSPTARQASVEAILKFVGRGRGVAQVLLGDLNAEPHEP
jgi:endonuclease/exonuclease/phosphatase family metal-dependent hydrolase